METKKTPHNARKEKKMNKTIPIYLLFILLIVSSVQLVFADEPISISFDPNPLPTPYYEPPSPPNNIRPVANITGPAIGYVNQSLIFSGQYSYDPDGTIIEYRWDFENDGLFDTEWTKENLTTHSYSDTGNYTIKLQVKDNGLATGVTLLLINLIQLPPPLQLPIAQANGPYQAYVNQTINFFSNGSYDPDGIIMNYSWDFGDNTLSYNQNSEHIYTQPGNYSATLTVRDNNNLSNTALASVYIREYQESITPDTSYSAHPMFPPIIMISCILLIIVIVSIFTRLMTPTQKFSISLRRQKCYLLKNGRYEKFGDGPSEIKEKTFLTRLKLLREESKEKRRICKPIGKSVFLKTGDEKLGDIIEIISDQNNQILGYKIKETKSEKVIHLFAEHCSQQKNNYICTPDCFTVPSKALEGLEFYDNIKPDIILLLKDNSVSKDECEKISIPQDDELRKNINHLYALDKMIKGSLYVLKKQHILIEDTLKDLQIKRVENMISQEQYLQMAFPYHQKLERVDQNIKKYREITKRLTQTSLRKFNNPHK
jgi:PKD repeat protein